MAAESPLDAGAIVVTYRLDKDERSFAKYRADLAKLVAETEAADKRMVISPRIDRQGARQWFDSLDGDMTRAEQRYDKTRAHFDRNPIKPAIERRALARYESALTSMQRSAERANRKINTALRFGTIVGGMTGVGLGSAFVASGVEFAKFEDQMFKVQAISGATAKQMDDLRKAAQRLAMDGRYSQQQLAEGQVELVKGGMAAADIYGGGLNTAYQLASAGQLELADAAMYTVNAMNLFEIAAGDSMKIADGLAAAANITTASVDDFGVALTQGGAAAKTAGLSFQDTVVWLEALAKMGIKNSDAGTSLKSAIIQATAGLSPRARQIMKLIGLDLFNAAGQLKDINEITKELVDSVGQYDRESQINILGQIFGSDGVRSAIALLEQGTDGVKALGDETAKQGEAARVTSVQNQGLAFSYLRMKNTLGVVAAQGFAPFDKNVTEAFNNLQGWLRKIAPELRGFSENINRILDTDMPWQDKVKKIWQALSDSRGAEMLRDGIASALSFLPELIAKSLVGALQMVPKIIYDAWNNSNWLGRAALTGLLAAKFGPAIASVMKMVGAGVSKIPGVGGIFDKLFGGRGTTPANPLFVAVTNPGFGAPIAGGPNGKGKGGPLSRGKDMLKQGTKLIPAVGMSLIANPMTWGVLATVIGGGALATKLSGQGPLSKKADVDRHRQFTPKMYRMRGMDFMKGREDLLEGDPKTRAKRIKEAIRQEMQNVPEQFRAAWAQGAIIWAKQMEEAKRLSRGTASDIRQHLVGSMKVISEKSAAAAWNYRQAISGMNATTLALVANAKKAGVGLRDVVRAAKAVRAHGGKAAATASQTIKGFFSSGGYVSGPRSSGVPVVLHGDEAVLNREQMDMIGRDRIMEVLAATGAPTISSGGAYARGGKPKKGGGKRKPEGDLAAILAGKPNPAKQRAADAERRRKEAARRRAEARRNPTIPGAQKFADQERALNIKLARAEGTTDYDDTTTKDLRDDLSASRSLEKLYAQRRRALEGMQRKYKLRGKGAWPEMRRAVDEELQGVINSHNAIKESIKSIEGTIRPQKDPNEQDLTAPQDALIENLEREIRVREARGGEGMSEPERQTLLQRLGEKLTWLQDKLRKAVGPKLRELRERLGQEIDQTAGEMISLRDQARSTSQQSTVNPAQQFAAARQDLYREFGSNSRPMPTGGPFAGFDAGLQGAGGGAPRGTMVTQNITIAQPPPDPHAFSRKLAFEIRGAI